MFQVLVNKTQLFYLHSQRTQNICITFVQRRPNVFDVGPTLYKCYANVLCSLGSCSFKGMVDADLAYNM